MKKKLALLVALVLCGHAATFGKSIVLQHPQSDTPLVERIEWAHRAARQQGLGEGYWIGYSIRRWMRANEFVMTGMYLNGWSQDRGPTLEEIIAGQTHTREKPRPWDSSRSLKDIAVLCYFTTGPGLLSEIEYLNTTLSPDLRGRSLIWLGRMNDRESFAFLEPFYEKISDRDTKESLIGILGMHQSPGLAFPFLKRVLQSDAHEELREQAAFWLGKQDTKDAYLILVSTVQKDGSEEVREGAVSGLAQMTLPEAMQSLKEFALSVSTPAEVRQSAIHWVSENLPEAEASAFLQRIVERKDDPEVQETALHGLTEIPGTTAILIRTAKTHPNSDVRGSAIHWLSEIESREVEKVLEQLAWGDPDEDIRDSAIHALSESSNREFAIEVLLKIMEKHPNEDTRDTAVHFLAEMKESRARTALRKYVQESE